MFFFFSIGLKLIQAESAVKIKIWILECFTYTLIDNLTMFLRTFSGSFLSKCGLLLATLSISLYRLSSNDVVASSMKSDRPALVDIMRPRSFFWARSPKSRVRLPVPPPAEYDPPPPPPPPPPLPIVFADCITAIFSHSERPLLVCIVRVRPCSRFYLAVNATVWSRALFIWGEARVR